SLAPGWTEVVPAAETDPLEFGRVGVRAAGLVIEHGRELVVEALELHAGNVLADEPFDGRHVWTILRSHNREGIACGLRPSCAAYPMHVILGVLRYVVIDHVAH